MNKKILLISIICVIAIIIVLGIILLTIKPRVNDNPINPNPNNNNTNPAIINNTNPNPSSESDVVDANNEFAYDLYTKYKSNEGNVFFSPFSISSALAMTYEGAIGETKDEMKNVMHFPDENTLRSGYQGLYTKLNNPDKAYKLSTANALWAEKTYTFKQDYLNTVSTYYNGNVTNLDFKQNAEASRLIINKWVEDKTNDKIKNLIPAGVLNSLTRLVLTNAVYFKANWTQQFDPVATYDQDFTLTNGNKIQVKTMHQTKYFNYAENNKLKILEMDYLGDDLSMLVILPKDNSLLSQVETSINKKFIDDLKQEFKSEEVFVSLPRFKFETKYMMAQDLQDMGMIKAFDGGQADFSGMTGNRDLSISQVIHQAFVNVSESGTEAAAATAVIMSETSAAEPKEPKEFKADHAFIFIIQEKDTGNILFMGRMSDPRE